MKGFVEGADRQQTTLLPECLDDWVDEGNPVRAVDVFVDALELRELGFDGVTPAATGRPGYHPSALLKLHAPRRTRASAGRRSIGVGARSNVHHPPLPSEHAERPSELPCGAPTLLRGHAPRRGSGGLVDRRQPQALTPIREDRMPQR
jgi:hypothetical protein